MKAKVTIYETKLTKDPASGAFVRGPGIVLTTAEVDAETVDGRREAARSLVRSMTGREPTISCTTDGGIAASVPART